MVTKRTFQQNALFRSGPNMNLNACVGDNGGPYDFADYGEGFFRGGNAIVEAVVTGGATVDLAIYPAAFAFRHGIELYLKQLLIDLIAFNGSKVAYAKNHGIEKYWRLVVAEMGKVEGEVFDPADVKVAAGIIGDFCQIDPTGQVFRYPENLKGIRHLTGLGVINVEVLVEGMSTLHGMLNFWHHQVAELRRLTRERHGYDV